MKRGALVSVGWLAPRLRQLQVVDATWFLAPVHGPRSPADEFAQARIPGSVRFDLDALSDPAEKDLPHMLAPADWFGAQMEELGLVASKPIVVYDRLGMFSAARAWWNLKVMGAADVMLLDGGLPAWLDKKLPFASGPLAPPTARGRWPAPPAHEVQKHVVSLQAMEAWVRAPDAKVPVIDARSAARFTGETGEPRAGLQPGHVPHSLNLPFGALLNADGTFKSDDELKAAFRAAGVSLDGPLRPQRAVCMCGSGTTAAVVAFALHNFFHLHAQIYDGSYAQWAKADAKRPVLTSTSSAPPAKM